MPGLTKQDKKDIKEIVDGSLEVNFPRLFEKALSPFAGAIQSDIAEIKKDVKEIKEDLTITKEDLTITKDKVFVIESEILDVKKKLENIVYRHELEAVKDRIAEIEKRAGIKK